jgi:hypothetical protein
VKRNRPKTGDKRATRKPLTIDRLPDEVKARLVAAREQEWKSWEAIEADSPAWKEWDKASPEAQKLFPGRKIPHSNAQRWYDIRVEQVKAQALLETEKAREFATAFAKRDFGELEPAVINALRDQVFSLMKAGADGTTSKQFRAELGNLLYLQTKLAKVQIDRQKLVLEEEKIGIERGKLEALKFKLGALKKDAAKKQLSPDELQKRLDELYGIA